MLVSKLKINGIDTPLGYSYDTLLASWSVTETESTHAADVLLEVTFSEDFSDTFLRTQGPHLNQGGQALDILPTPRTTYYWRVTVTGNAGDSATSEAARFETGKREEPWQADFIAAAGPLPCHPVFVKRFTPAKKLWRARLYASAAGLFEASLNGEKLGCEYLAPYTSDYDRELQAITFDLDDLLAEGENTLEILVGPGWFSGLFGLELQDKVYGDTLACVAELRLEYEDGTADVLGTDAGWFCRGSDIVASGIYDGEEIDLTLWQGKENAELPVRVVNPREGEGVRNLDVARLRDRYSLPVLARQALPLLAGIARGGDKEMCSNSLAGMRHMGFLPIAPAALEAAIAEISMLRV